MAAATAAVKKKLPAAKSQRLADCAIAWAIGRPRARVYCFCCESETNAIVVRRSRSHSPPRFSQHISDNGINSHVNTSAWILFLRLRIWATANEDEGHVNTTQKNSRTKESNKNYVCMMIIARRLRLRDTCYYYYVFTLAIITFRKVFARSLARARVCVCVCVGASV